MNSQPIRDAIEAGDLSKAIRLHRVLFPPHPVPLIRETDESDLRECLETPLPIFSFLSEKELHELRVRMAIAICLRTRPERALSPDAAFPWPYPMSPEAATQNFFNATGTYRNVSVWLKMGFVQTVKISNSNDGPCPVCEAAADREYEIRDLPQLPLHNCVNLNDVGCRCVLVAAKLTETRKRGG
ncbi:MAG: hypothetical protein ABSB50_20585 [Terracidiphilus sp.]|jgi:hypothetical protein